MMKLTELTLPSFTPLRWASGPHAQTVLGRYWSRHKLPGTDETLRIPLQDGDQLVALLRRPHLNSASKKPKAVIYLFHGLGGSTDSDYIPRIAEVFHHHTDHAVMMANHRGCGPGAGLASQPYHSGRSDDLSAVIAHGKNLFPDSQHLAIGFSLSGNALLLLLGAFQNLTQPDFAISVNAPIDLAVAADLLGGGINRIYDFKFVRDARREIECRRRSGLLKVPVRIPLFATLKDIDDLYTAPHSGFENRENYYQRCSSIPHLSRIRIPTLAITSADDPFVASRSYREVQTSSMVRIQIENHGGHMGFLADQPNELGTRHWLDLALLRAANQLLS